MKLSTQIAAIVSAFMVIGCADIQDAETVQTEQITKLSFAIGHNYFVRNDVPDDALPTIIRNAAERDSVLCVAQVMSKKENPTQIDFEKETVVNVAMATTDYPTELEIQDVYLTADSIIHVDYTAEVGPRSSFSMKPYIMVILQTADLAKSKDIVLTLKNQTL